MPANLRHFQSKADRDINASLLNLHAQHGDDYPAGVFCVSPTGSGKTVIMSHNATQYDGPTAAIAHRQELTTQISLAFARNGVRHDIVAPDDVVAAIRRAHVEDDEIGVDHVKRGAWTRVCGIDTLNNLNDRDPWLKAVERAYWDEGHHVLVEPLNKWGIGYNRFVNADHVLFSACPHRADGRGVGKGQGGVADVMIEAIKMRQAIEEGYLTDYDLITCPVSDLDLHEVTRSAATGEYNKTKLAQAVRASKKIVGDVVDAYCKHAYGKLGITFAVDIEEAKKLTAEFNRRGIVAEVVHAKMNGPIRRAIMKRFKRREVLQLVNVDLFGEGVDVPACEVVSMARPTLSLSLFIQQFGRALRLMIDRGLHLIWDTLTVAQRLYEISRSLKPKALIIDHVMNWAIHNLPDNISRVWSMLARERRQATDPDLIPLRRCTSVDPKTDELCLKTYQRHLTICPHCLQAPKITELSRSIEMVDGDMMLMDPAILRELRAESSKIEGPAFTPNNVSQAAKHNITERHQERRVAQYDLRDTMQLWMGWRASVEPSLTWREHQKLFYITFGIDVMTAQTLGRPDANNLRERVQQQLNKHHIVKA